MSFVLTLVASNDAQPVAQNHIRLAYDILSTTGISQTCQPIWLEKNKAVDLGLSDKPPQKAIRDIQKLLYGEKIDVFISPVDKRRKKLLLADMDSTIVASETLDELAVFAGLKDKIAAITAKAMEGQIDFSTALQERVALLKGLSTEALEKTLRETEINPGARILVNTMRKHGAFCVLVSGGFTYFTDAVARDVGFLDNHGNTLEIRNNVLTGKVVPPILDKHAKVEFLQKHAGNLKIKPSDCMTIGDGANDIPMLELAGFGVGFRPKEVVAKSIENIIIHGDLSAALYAQGYTVQDIEK